MKEAARLARNTERLADLYPTFRKRVAQVIAILEKKGLRPRIQSGWRSLKDQRKAYDAGHTKVLFGFHNVTDKDGNPEALAVDLLDDNFPLNPGKAYLLQLAAAAQSVNLVTGIRWGLPAKLIGAIDTAIQSEDWSANVKIGWDPTHIEPTGITISQAKGGMRPA